MTSTSTERPLLLGHRGARRSAPENTLPAFDLALAHGCDGFEFDLRRTADGRSVVCHDAKLRGMEIANEAFARIHELHGCASLEDVLGQFASRAFLDIEVKVPGLEEHVLAALRECPPKRGYVVSSFLPEVIQELRRRAAIPTGFICDRQRELARWELLGVDVLIPHRKLATRSLVDQAHAAGKRIFVWTVNRQQEMRRFGDWGVDAIISDDTELLGRTFAS